MRLNNKNGFTFAELVVVLLVIAIMAAIAVPSFISWLPDMRLKAAARELYGAAMKAKGEAVKRNKNCALTFNQAVPVSGGTTYVYIVYEDTNHNFIYDDGESLLAQMWQWPKGVTFDTNKGGGDGLTFTNDSAGNPAIVFRATSIPTSSIGGFANGTAFLSNVNGKEMSVVVNQAGNISIN
jgi:prepilin-type N-terminal cleavage/methylation domain-containing protein